MWESFIILLYFSMDCIFCQESDLWIEPKKDRLLLAAGDILRLDCVHVYTGNVADVATFSKDGAYIPMSNDKGFTILVKSLPNSTTVTRTTTLKKMTTTLTDSGVYRCDVQDKSVKITVDIIQVVPVHAVLPTNSTDAVALQCNVTGSTVDSHVIRWVWTFKNKTLRNDDKYSIINNINGGTLVIKYPDRSNIGKYLCSLTQKNDVKIEKPRPVFLRASPVVDRYTVEAHETGLVFKCSASGSPVPSIVWTKDGAKMNSTNYSTLDFEQNTIKSYMVLSKVDDDDDGIYLCIAVNDIEPFNATAQIVIGREERSRLISSGGPVTKTTSSIPITISVLFITIFFTC